MLDHIAAGILRDHADDGQDGALLRLLTALYAVFAPASSPRQMFPASMVSPSSTCRAQTAQESKGKNDAGVAARALERAAGRRHAEQLAGARFRPTAEISLTVDFIVRDMLVPVSPSGTENVQRINRLAVLFKQIGSRNNHFLEGATRLLIAVTKNLASVSVRGSDADTLDRNIYSAHFRAVYSQSCKPEI